MRCLSLIPLSSSPGIIPADIPSDLEILLLLNARVTISVSLPSDILIHQLVQSPLSLLSNIIIRYIPFSIHLPPRPSNHRRIILSQQPPISEHTVQYSPGGKITLNPLSPLLSSASRSLPSTKSPTKITFSEKPYSKPLLPKQLNSPPQT